MSLPPNYLELLLGGGVTCVTAMMMYGGGDPSGAPKGSLPHTSL